MSARSVLIFASAALGLSLTACTNAAHGLNRQGQLAITTGDLKGAEASFREALAGDPSNPVSHYYLGYLAEKRGNFYRARDWYRKAAGSGDETPLEVPRTSGSIEAPLFQVAELSLTRVNATISRLEGR